MPEQVIASRVYAGIAHKRPRLSPVGSCRVKFTPPRIGATAISVLLVLTGLAGHPLCVSWMIYNDCGM